METRKYAAVTLATTKSGSGNGGTGYYMTAIVHHAVDDKAAIVKWAKTHVATYKMPVYIVEVIEKISCKEVPVEITELAMPEVVERSK